jgi:hypothetical protein
MIELCVEHIELGFECCIGIGLASSLALSFSTLRALRALRGGLTGLPGLSTGPAALHHLHELHEVIKIDNKLLTSLIGSCFRRHATHRWVCWRRRSTASCRGRVHWRLATRHSRVHGRRRTTCHSRVHGRRCATLRTHLHKSFFSQMLRDGSTGKLQEF